MSTPSVVVMERFADIVQTLESDEFYTEVAVASSPLSLFRRVATHSATSRLSLFLQSETDNVEKVLEYATHLCQEASGNVRSDKDAALCACVVALGRASAVGVDDFFRRLRTTRGSL